MCLPLGEGNALGRAAADYVLNLDRGRGNADHLVAAVHDFALTGDEYILTQLEKNSLWLAGRTGKTVKLQGDRRSLLRAGRLGDAGGLGRGDRKSTRLNSSH